MISYRLAVVGGLAGLGSLLLWLCRAGLDVGAVALYLAAALIMFPGITRLVIQTGMHYLTIPMLRRGLRGPRPPVDRRQVHLPQQPTNALATDVEALPPQLARNYLASWHWRTVPSRG